MGEIDQLRSEIGLLRGELADVRDFAEAALTAVVGGKKVEVCKREAAVSDAIRREDLGMPLNKLVGGDLLDRLEWDPPYGWNLRTVEELARQRTREEFASLPGVGKARLAKVEDVMAERGLTWVVAS